MNILESRQFPVDSLYKVGFVFGDAVHIELAPESIICKYVIVHSGCTLHVPCISDVARLAISL